MSEEKSEHYKITFEFFDNNKSYYRTFVIKIKNKEAKVIKRPEDRDCIMKIKRLEGKLN